jgi:heme-degrading monooxygenase HmoA
MSGEITFVSVTRLHLRSKRFWLSFVIYALRGGARARRSPGFRGGALGHDAQGGQWTTTAWESEAAMRDFRNAGVHAVAMRKLLEWCDEASFASYTTDEGLPTADTVYQRLAAGRTSKVNHPSAAHTAGRTVSNGAPRFVLKLRPPR